MKRYGVGLFVGRFQPLHKGHMHAIKEAYAMCSRLIVAIGSSQESGTKRNPLPAGVRLRIIRGVIRDPSARMRGLKFIRVPDFRDDEEWYNYIVRLVPRVDVVFSADRVTKRIFRQYGVAVHTPTLYRRNVLIGSGIRKRIKSGAGWHRLVPRRAVKDLERYEDTIKRSMS